MYKAACIGIALAAATLGAGAETVPVPEPSEEAMRFYWSGNAIWIFRQAWVILIPALFVFTGFGAKFDPWARNVLRFPFSITRKVWVTLVPGASVSKGVGAELGKVSRWAGRRQAARASVAFALFMAMLFFINLPLNFGAGYVWLHAFGLSNQTFLLWLRNAAMTYAVMIVIGMAVVWIPYLLMRKAPRTWWAWTGVLMVPFIFFLALIAPVYIDPLFNDFGPMQDKALEERVLNVVERAGVDGARVYEVNKSQDTKALNAYVTGFMDTKRVVLWDTIINTLSEDELLFVVAHELGHYVLNHVVQGIIFASVLMFVLLFFIHNAARYILNRYGRRIGYRRLAHAGSIPLMYMLVQIVTLIGEPVGHAYSRHIEHESDRFALELMQDNEAAAKAFVKLQQENLGNPRPGPVYTLFRGSHPSLGERIDFANEYRPWETGEPLVYGGYFSSAE